MPLSLSARIAIAMTSTLASASALSADENELEKLQQQLDALAAIVSDQAAEIASLKSAASASTRTESEDVGTIQHQPIGRFPDDAIVTSGSFDGAVTIPGSSASFKLGGYVQSDISFDIDNLGFEDSLNLRTIPLDGSEDDERKTFRAHARYSRLNLDIRDETTFGDFRLFMEVDFFGSGGEATNNYSPVLRHATVQLGNLYVGQWWSYFTDLSASPESTTTSVGLPIVRSPGIRYARDVAPGWRAGIGIENPAGDLSGPTDELVSDSMPNVAGFVQYTSDWGHLRLAGLALELESTTDSEITGGVNLTGRINLPSLGTGDNLAFAIQSGSGFARYYATLANVGLDGVINDSGQVEATGIVGGYVAYQHWWNSTLRSTLQAGAFEFDSPVGSSDSAFDGGEGYMVNLFWTPIANATFGIELIHGSQTVVDGRSGDGTRIGAIARFDF